MTSSRLSLPLQLRLFLSLKLGINLCALAWLVSVTSCLSNQQSQHVGIFAGRSAGALMHRSRGVLLVQMLLSILFFHFLLTL